MRCSIDIWHFMLTNETTRLMPLMNLALTRKQIFPLKWTQSTKTDYAREDSRETVDVYDIHNAEGSLMPEISAIHQKPAETALLYTSLSINSFKNDEPWGELNHTSWVWKNAAAKPLLAMDRDAWENNTEQANPLRSFNVPWYEAGEERWIDLVVNNIDDKGHPFHLVSAAHQDNFLPMTVADLHSMGMSSMSSVHTNASLVVRITPLKKNTMR